MLDLSALTSSSATLAAFEPTTTTALDFPPCLWSEPTQLDHQQSSQYQVQDYYSVGSTDSDASTSLSTPLEDFLPTPAALTSRSISESTPANEPSSQALPPLFPGLSLPKPTTKAKSSKGKKSKPGPKPKSTKINKNLYSPPSSVAGQKRSLSPDDDLDEDEDGEEEEDEETLHKRARNNIAAKKYRQKKLDRITELEEEVDAVKRERDELRILLARQEAQTSALREMLAFRTKEG